MITPVSNMLNLPVPFTRANYCQDKSQTSFSRVINRQHAPSALTVI